MARCRYCGKYSDRGFIRECRACRAKRGAAPVPRIRPKRKRTPKTLVEEIALREDERWMSTRRRGR